MTLEFYGQSLEKYSNAKFHLKNRPVEDELIHAHGWTKRHEEVHSSFSQFC